MKTEVVMKRALFGVEVRQKSQSEFFSATDLVRAGNVWRKNNGYKDFNITLWFKRKGTIEFIEEIEAKYGKAFQPGRGRGKHTWVHPLLFIDLALSINPKLKIEVYEWLFDHLIQNRNNSGDSYKEMCGYLYARHSDKRDFPRYITDVAGRIKSVCGVEDWQGATEEQLKKRDKIHDAISLLSNVLKRNDEAVRLGILQHTHKRIT